MTASKYEQDVIGAPATGLNYYQFSFMNVIDLGLIDPQLAGTNFYFLVQVSGNMDLEAQSVSAYEAAYTASVANDRLHLAAAFYVNDSRSDVNWNPVESYTSANTPPGWPLPPFVLDALIAANALGPGVGVPSLMTGRNLGRIQCEWASPK